jgi:hypothetical protein
MMLSDIGLNFRGLWRMGTIGTIFCETAYPALCSAMPRPKMMAKLALFRAFRTSQRKHPHSALNKFPRRFQDFRSPDRTFRTFRTVACQARCVILKLLR